MKLHGARITLVSADASLALSVCSYYERNRSFLSTFEPKRNEEFYTPRFHEQELLAEQAYAQELRSVRYYIVENNNPDEIIGTISLSNIVWKAFCSCFLGYALDSVHLNLGYMTEAVELITCFAFKELGLHRIEANVVPRNKASLRVLEKCGYKNEGLSLRYLKINGIWEDHVHMVKLNENGDICV